MEMQRSVTELMHAAMSWKKIIQIRKYVNSEVSKEMKHNFN